MVFDVSIVFVFVKASIPEVKKAANEKSAAKQGGYINGKKMLEVMFSNDLTWIISESIWRFPVVNVPVVPGKCRPAVGAHEKIIIWSHYIYIYMYYVTLW